MFTIDVVTPALVKDTVSDQGFSKGGRWGANPNAGGGANLSFGPFSLKIT